MRSGRLSMQNRNQKFKLQFTGMLKKSYHKSFVHRLLFPYYMSVRPLQTKE